MTTAEITALRKELEGALLKAFTDFQRLTGVGIYRVDVERVDISRFGFDDEVIVSRVSVLMESL